MSLIKDIAQLMIVIDSEDRWDHVMHESLTRLVVIDMHQEWCGSVEAVRPSMSRLLLEYDACEERFLYCTASFGKVEAKIKQAVAAAGNGLDLKKNGCVPLFGIFKNQDCISVISGVDSPTLLLHIAQNIPPKVVKE
ncbi:hypothetical protein B484DRAFT_482352 [Ochromonadaceae sp. CCMP2298]|nr:hypothetical protein B484DRAFT_482352 [Ochromonadaceae sp. CCMP2298]